jgi:tetratricopeptide (TPR) repeat protein
MGLVFHGSREAHSIQSERRPTLIVYLAAEAALILGLTYFTFIGGGQAGLYFYKPRLVSQVIIAVLAAGWLASKFLPAWPWPRWRPWPSTPIDRPLTISLAIAAMSSVFSIHPRLSLENTCIIFIYALAFWFCREQVLAGWFADLLTKCLLIVGGIVCILAGAELLGWYLGWPDGPAWPSLGFGLWPLTIPRIGELLGGANQLAAYLALLSPLVFASGLASARWSRRLFLTFYGLLMLGLVFATQSRGGIVGALAGLSALVVGSWPALGERWPKLRPTRRRVAVLGSLLLGLLVLLIVVLGQWRGRSEGWLTREDMWLNALRMAVHRPLTGVGPGGFGLAYLYYRDAGQIAEVHSHAHSAYFHTLATLGVAGALVSAWLCLALAVAAWRLWRADPDRDRQWVRLGAMAGLVAFATHGMFDTFFVFPAVFFVAVLLAVFALRPIPASSHAEALPARWWLKPVIASAVAILGLGVGIWSDLGLAAFDRAMATSWQGNWTATSEALQTAVRRDPAYDYYRLQLGLAYGQLAAHDPELMDDALAAYRAGRIDSDYYALDHANYAWLLWNSGDKEAGLGEMARAVQLAQGRSKPTLDAVLANYQLNLGFMLEQLGRMEAARAEYAQAVVLEPGWLDLSFWDAGSLAARDRMSLAESAMTLLGDSSEGLSDYRRGNFAYYLRNWDEAEHWLEKSLSSNPDNSAAWIDLGMVWLATGQYSRALDAAGHILRKYPVASGAFLVRARAYLALNDLERAAADLQILQFLSPGYQTHLLSGELAEARGEWEEAAREYRAAVDAASSATPAYYYGPVVWGRPPLATDSLPFLMQPAQSESLIMAYVALGRVYTRLGMATEARDVYETILRIDPGHLEAKSRLAELP